MLDIKELQHRIIELERTQEKYQEFFNSYGFVDLESISSYMGKNLKEIQTLKDRWEKLKEYLMYTLEEKQSSPKYYKFNNVLDKMQELEKED